MARSLPIASAKARFAECIREAEAGKTIVLTRHGRPVARLAPMSARAETPTVEVREPEHAYDKEASTPAVPQSARSRREELERLLEVSIWPRVPADQLGTPISKREREEILGYGDEGA